MRTKRSLADYLDDYGRKYPVEDTGHVLRSLVYFADADAAPLPAGLDDDHWCAIRTDFES